MQNVFYFLGFYVAMMIVLFTQPLNTLPTETLKVEKRQASDETVLDLIPIGEFTNTQHNVRGMVWAYNNTLMLIEDFAYDGFGFGVYFQVATKGRNRNAWVANRKTIGYPNPEDFGTPLEKAYGTNPDKVDWIVLRMPSDILVQDIKWMTVWCDQFHISFGEVKFPSFV